MSKKNKKIFYRAAQATLELVFTFIVLVIIFYGCVRALQWLGVVLLSPANRHYQGLYSWSGTASSGSASYNYPGQMDNVDARLPQLKLVYPGQILHP